MPHAIAADATFDTIESEILFTRAALRADPDATDLLSHTDTWLSLVEPARAKERAAREAVENANAERAVANARLDATCVAFGDDLHMAVQKDHRAARWLQFFPIAVSSFVKQALARQVVTVKGWITSSKDPVLEKHRANLETWAARADDALVKTRGTALVRGEAHQAREDLAAELTRERDGLHEALSARARDRELPRDWADVFFRTESRPRSASERASDDSAAQGSPSAA